VVAVKNKNRPSPERAMIKEISNGYKQIRNIPNDAIGIICIDISSYITAGMQHNSQEFMAIFEDAKKTINDLFKGPHYKRLGGIIMTWNYQKMTPTGSIRVAINVDGIVHNKSTKPMPEEFLKGEYKGQKMVFVPRDPTVVIEEGVALFKRGKVEDSVEHFDMVTTHYPQLIEGWIYKAICLRKMKKYVEALSSLKQALAIDPKHRLGLLSLAQCYADLGMKDNASKTLDDMIQIFPNDAQLWYNRALMFYEQGDKESARRCIQKSLEYKSDYEPAMNLAEKLNKNDWDGQYSEDISSNRFN
jgi:tetratricopeptide (TPR) repeat protein